MSPSSSPPRIIGRFELVAHLATGGMAEIFLARERGLAGLERLVVIKRILPRYAHDTSFVDMFLREARIIARLNHPNVIQIYELGAEQGNYYIAMEYVHGSTLREMQLLAERSGVPLTVDVVVSAIEQACRGLHAAHELRDLEGNPLGLIHRDVSPHNLMCATEGFIKVLDFGVAKSTHGSEVTHSGHLKGKFAYMSPEQCQGLKLDRRVDVFALGIVTWESLTGQRLFKRDKDLDMMRAVVQEPSPPPSQFNPAVPPDIDQVVLRALHKDRDARYQSADEMRTDLLKASREHGIHYGAEILSDFLARVAGDQLAQRRATLQEALERSLSANEQHSLLHVTDSNSASSRSGLDEAEEPATVVERPRASSSSGGPATAAPQPAALRATRPGGQGPAYHSGLTQPSQVSGVTPPSQVSGVTHPSQVSGVTHPSQVSGVTHPSQVSGAHVVPGAAPAARKYARLPRILGAAAAVAVLGAAAFFFVPRPGGELLGGDEVYPERPILLGEPLKIGWPPIAPPEILQKEAPLLIPYLERELQRPVSMEVTATYDALADGIQDGTFDVAMLPPLLYVQSKFAEPNIQFVALRQFGGATSSDALLVTRMDSKFDGLKDLEGKTFCLTDRGSTTGYFQPRDYIRRQGYNPDQFIGAIVWSGDHLQVLRDLLAGKCDVAATYSGSYLSADSFGIPITRIRIFQVTGHVPLDTVVVRPGMSAATTEKIKDALIGFDPQKELGKPAAGEVLKITGFSEGSDADFNPLRAAVQPRQVVK